MIGWWIVISTQTAEERHRHAGGSDSILASWEVGPGGLDWLKLLAATGAIQQIRSDGYPNSYIAPAGVVLPLLVDGPPAHSGPLVVGDDYVMPAGWVGKIEIHNARIAACSADQQLTIEAWDLS